jgi:dihydropteroate synthase
MGVVNVTPDSFSDGGIHLQPDEAVAGARRMVAEGAAIVDVGGESTRPGAEGVTVEEELRRVMPVLERLTGLPVSIDTARAEVARRALALGAELVNDVTALRGDSELAGVVADAGAYLCLMHMQGEPRTMQAAPRYDDVVGEVVTFLEERLAFAVAEGIPEEHVCLDPGIGFGKSPDHNLELVRRLGRLAELGRPVLVGLSRKSTLGKILGDPEATVGSQAASVGAAVAAFDRGASIFRVHDVQAHVEALAVAAAVERGALTGTVSDAGVTVEVLGIELHGFHGLLEEERREGQRFVVDVWLEPTDGAAGATDRIEDVVDYRDVVALVREVSDARAYRLLEAFSAALAERLVDRFPVARARVRVRKPDVRLALPVEHAAVTSERRRSA